MMNWKKRCYCLLACLMVLGVNGGLPAQALWQTWLQPRVALLSASTVQTADTDADYPMYALGFEWNEGQSRWDTVTQTTFSYVSTGGLQQRIVSAYNSGSYTQDYRETHHYNLQGYDSLTLGETWGGSAWVPSFRFLRTFDALGNITQSIGNTWNGASWDTSSGYRAMFTYHNATQVASVIQESYALGSGWEPDYKMEYSFDVQDRWDTVTGYVPNLGNWDPDMRLVGLGWHDFSKNQPDSGRFERYTTAWENFERYRVTYSQYDSQVWIYDKFSTDWDPSQKYIFNYDSHGNEILSEIYEWIGVWHQAEGIVTHPTYNPSGQMTEVWRELFDGYLYRYHDKQVFSNFFVGRPEPADMPAGVTVYPNPATDALHFHLQAVKKVRPISISLYDLQGRLAMETLLNSGGEDITIALPASLENGAYFYRVVSAATCVSGKVLIQR